MKYKTKEDPEVKYSHEWIETKCPHEWVENSITDSNFGVVFGCIRVCKLCGRTEHTDHTKGTEWEEVE